jgi:predicted nucleic acid-binding protein
MSFLWDSNILRHYLDQHPRLLGNLKKIPRHTVALPVVVAAEQLRGRASALLNAEASQLARAQELCQQTQTLLSRFHVP